MQLYDYLTEEDIATLTDWIEINETCNVYDMRAVLQEWNKNKRTMFKLLGKKLRVKLPVELDVDGEFFYRQLDEIFTPPSILSYEDSKSDLFGYRSSGCEFIDDFFQYLQIKLSYDYENKWREIRWLNYSGLVSNERGVIYGDTSALTYLFERTVISKGILPYSVELTYNSKKLVLPKGMKIMRAIRKMLELFNYPNMNLFEEWRNDISNLTTIKKIKGNLVLSIHPLDFLTLSDNNCGWRSCVAMQHDYHGDYHVALTEMLNSNCTIVAYMESVHKKFTFNFHDIPNKSYRQIFICTKDIICGGKSYPYTHEDLTFEILKHLQSFAKQNLQWRYRYNEPQRYRDIHVSSNVYALPYARAYHNYKVKGQKIIFYTYGYYNDFISDKSYKYWCVRNKVEQTKFIRISGPATCLMCGDRVLDSYRDVGEREEFPDEEVYCGAYGSNMVCRKCYNTYSCKVCGRIDSMSGHYRVRRRHGYDTCVCEECMSKEMLYIDRSAKQLDGYFAEREEWKRWEHSTWDKDPLRESWVPLKAVEGDINYAEQYGKYYPAIGGSV